LFAVVALSFALAGIVCFVLGLIVASRRLGVPFDALIMTTVAVLVAVTGWATFLAWMLFFGIPVDIGSVLFGAVSLAIGLWQAYPHRRLLVDAWHEIVERLRREQLLWAGVALLLVVQVSRTVHTLREIGDFGYDPPTSFRTDRSLVPRTWCHGCGIRPSLRFRRRSLVCCQVR
jgi:uncharacterized membrane protein